MSAGGYTCDLCDAVGYTGTNLHSHSLADGSTHFHADASPYGKPPPDSYVYDHSYAGSDIHGFTHLDTDT